MAKKAKGNRIQVILECTEQKESGVPGMSRYITTKNRKNTPDRLEMKKYNPYLKKVTVHREIPNVTSDEALCKAATFETITFFNSLKDKLRFWNIEFLPHISGSSTHERAFNG